MKVPLKNISLLVLPPLLFYLCAFFFVQEDVLKDNEVELSKKLDKEKSGLPSLLLSYPKINLQWRASYTRDPFFGSEESIFILQSSDPWKDLERYYLKSIKTLNWQLIQHLHKNGTCLLIAESPFQNLLTFVISASKVSSVKIYTRLSTLY